MVQISAAIITFNEEHNIERCLKSLRGVVDEIVVIDSHSEDKTEEICRNFGCVFIQRPFPGHIEQKNFAIDQTTNDVVLALDADEALDDKLRDSILKVKGNMVEDGFKMNRLTNYCGHWVRHSGWYPDTKIRLFRKDKARWGGVNPHDKIEMTTGSRVGKLDGDLLHYSYYTREDHLKQIEYFSGIAARELHAVGRSSNWALISLKVVAQFFKTFFLKTGFLDGGTGFTIARLSAFATYRKYYKLKRLNAGVEI